MDNKKNDNRERIDISHLKIINGVKFTSREIDILSCILRGQRAKVIASFLSISSRTVDTHICNILAKLNCTSREGILDFIEKAGKFCLLRKHYHNLLTGESNGTQGYTIIPNPEVQKSKNFFETLPLFFKNKKFWAVSSIVMGVIFFSMWGLPSKEQFISTGSVRSDLRIPTENVFLKRPGLIKKMGSQLKGKQGIETIALVGVVGIGGAGKTTLAREFGKTYNATVVWEINAENKESLVASFWSLAYALAQTPNKKNDLEFIQAIQDTEAKEKQLLVLIQRWLKEKQRWLLIYDNLENFSDIKKYLPENTNVWGNGKVIITTRDSNIKNTNFIKPEKVIEIEELTPEEAFILFTKILYGKDSHRLSPEQKAEISKFLEEIPPFPLDVSAAAYYLKTSQATFDEYLKKMRTFSKSFEQVQESLLKEKTNYTKTRYGILTLSLKKLIEVNPRFKGLLFLSCILDSQNIPRFLFDGYTDKETVDAFFNHLRKYSFMTKETADNFSMHRSTQAIGLAFLLEMLTKEDEKNFIEKIISVTNEVYEKPTANSCESKVLLIPHLEALNNNIERLSIENTLKQKYQQKILLMLGRSHFACTGNRVLARKYWSQTFEMKTKNPYISSLDLATTLKDLGVIGIDTGLPKEAIAYCKKSLKLTQKMHGSEILMAETLRVMGFAYSQNENFRESINCFQKALKTIFNIPASEKIKAEISILSTMALIYAREYLNKYETEKIKEYLNKSIRLYNSLKRDNKLSDEEIFSFKNRIGRAYNLLGMYTEALESHFEESLKMIERKNLSGDMHFGKIFVFLGAGEALLRKGNLKKAEKMLTDCILTDRALGGGGFFLAGLLRVEARIRLEKLDEAYEDISWLAELLSKRGTKTNEAKLSNILFYYHAAIIKYKQNDLRKSAEHFAEFFKPMKDFCKGFLEEKEYKELAFTGAFAAVDLSQTPSKSDMKQYLNRSIQIFTAIYGPDHPFVRDYVMKN